MDVNQQQGVEKRVFPTAEKILEHLPDDWETMQPEQKLDCWMKAFDHVVEVSGNWILINGDMTLLQLMDK